MSRMKIAISANDSVEGSDREKDISTLSELEINPRFGRCRYFILVEVEDGTIKGVESIENEGAKQGHGAGIRAAQQVGESGANYVITGDLGPNSTQVFEKLGIAAYHSSGIIKEAISGFLEGKLSIIGDKTAGINDIQDKKNAENSKNSENFEKSENSEKYEETGNVAGQGSERLFFPLLDDKGENSRISEHFGHAPYFGIYDMKNKSLKIIANDLDHADSSKSPIEQIQEAVNPTAIFAKGIGARAIDIIRQKGLSLKKGDYETVGEAVRNIDNLEDLNESCGHEEHQA